MRSARPHRARIHPGRGSRLAELSGGLQRGLAGHPFRDKFDKIDQYRGQDHGEDVPLCKGNARRDKDGFEGLHDYEKL